MVEFKRGNKYRIEVSDLYGDGEIGVELEEYPFVSVIFYLKKNEVEILIEHLQKQLEILKTKNQ